MATLITSQGLAPGSVDGASIAAASVDLTTKVTGVLPVANGGTNASAALNNNRVIVSSGSAIVESAAITASRALVSDTNGLPVASSVTDVELGYVSGVTSSIQTQLNGKQPTGNYITDLTGDATASGPGSAALTFATVNSNVGSFGSSTAIPSFTVNAKGLITAASTNAVIAPAGTLTGTTLNATVVNSSLTSVGTLTTGVWNATAITETRGGTNQTSYTTGDTLYASASNTLAKLPIGTVNQVLSVSAGGVPTWTTPSSYTSVNNKVYYVSTVGNDANIGYDPTKPFLTLGAALTAAGSSGNQICVFPGTYAGNYTITQQNLTISAANYETGGIVNFTGTLNVNHTGSSVRITGCAFATINHQNTGSLYLANCKTNTALNLSGNAYFESSYSESANGTVSVTGTGNKVFTNGCKVGTLTVNNAAAVVNMSSNITANPITVQAGTVFLNDIFVYSAGATLPAITATGATSGVFINGGQMLTPAGGNARISIGASVLYNLRSILFDRANSTLSGTLVITPVTGDQFAMRSQQLLGSTSGILTVQPAASTTSYTVTMPAAQGAANTFLRNDGSGTLTWQAAAAALTPYSYTLTGTDITNKFITLPATPTQPTNTLMTVIGGPAQDYGTDYTVTTNQLGWNGLTLDGVLVAGDKLQVLYI
jgi:hypothetical protein